MLDDESSHLEESYDERVAAGSLTYINITI